jgi:hypothetical protein
VVEFDGVGAVILFCVDPIESGRPDRDFEREIVACDAAGLQRHLVDWEALVEERRPDRAVRHVPPRDDSVVGVYRGWMMPPDRYADLHSALVDRGVELINSPGAYRHCHYLPESYDVIREVTPRTTWLRCGADVGIDLVMEALAPFGSGPVVVKDFVKSQKHAWREACFIPSAADRAAVERVVRRFLELQGDSLAEGLVFREYVELEPIGNHPQSGMPLSLEYRLFFVDGDLVNVSTYWDEMGPLHASPTLEQFREIASKVQSRFFAMDVARLRVGGWIIVELGDGQVSGLPEQADAEGFYRALSGRMNATRTLASR